MIGFVKMDKENYIEYLVIYKDETRDELFLKKEDYENFVECLASDKILVLEDFKFRETIINFLEVKKIIKIN